MKNLSFWLKLSVLNFFIVAILGVLMRYKIAFSLPLLDQKHVQEAHSHFAFYGWVTQCLYAFIADYMARYLQPERLKKYHILLILNAIISYLMVPMFIWKGYFAGSIAVSTAALLVSFAFFAFSFIDLKPVKDVVKPWLISGLFFSSISSAGVFLLAYMMATKNIDQNIYLASTYYYLHFQYNGFFIFSCIGLLIYSLNKIGAEISFRENKTAFLLMFVGCIIGYGLSVLWAKLPMWLFIIIILGTLSQTLGAVKLYSLVKRSWGNAVQNWSPLQRFALMFAGFAFFVKILLQLGSNIPAVNQFAFGFRNIVIAYLHLVLLMCVSVFLMSQIFASRKFIINSSLKNGFRLLMAGIFLNEVILGLMGVFSISYIAIPGANVLLLAVSVVMMSALAIIYFSLKKAK